MTKLLTKRKARYLILLPLVFAGFIHLVNPVGHPDIFFDEGIYMRRAMHTLDTGNPQEAYFYDHPYLGQLVLAGVLYITNYPQTDGTSDSTSLQNLYLIPRVFMGIIAMVSTFLVYQIGRERFGENVGLLASMLFAVMPFTWMLDRILLDCILLPFLLASILFANRFSSQGKMWLLPLSGVLLGLAIFTKIPAFVFIPIGVWLVFQNRKKYRDILVWIIPVLLIPMLWPIHSIMLDQFDFWIEGITWQSQRSSSILEIIGYFLIIDPVLFGIGMAGIIYGMITKNKFVLFWFVPFMIFLTFIGFKQYFHWIPLFPVFCIAAAVWLLDMPKYIRSKTAHRIIILSILAFGFSNTVLVVTNDISYNQFEALSFVMENYEGTILASPVYSWILYDVYEIPNVPSYYAMVLFEEIETRKITLIADKHFMIDQNDVEEIAKTYNDTESVKYFPGRIDEFDTNIYPYTNLKLNDEAFNIDVRKGVWSGSE